MISQNSSWDNVQVIAFDFFDTLVHRNCHPEEILYKWAKNMSAFLKFSVEASKLYEIRKSQEKALKKINNIEENTYTQLCRAIFDKIKTQLPLAITYDIFYESSRKFETSIELESIYLNKDIMPLVQKGIRKGKKIIIISDFYNGKDFIKRILRHLKIEDVFYDIFVSSDVGLRKSTGNLYKYVLEKLDINSESMLMIGDNYKSDILMARKLGIQTIHRPYSDECKKNELDNIKIEFKKIMFGDLESAPLNGYLSPILYFVSSLYRKLIQKNVKNVLFCSREGQLMKALFDLYQDEFIFDKKIKTHYFCVSRRSTLLPSFNELENEDFNQIFRQYKQLKLKDFLYSIGFEYEECDEIFDLTNFNGNLFVKNIKEDLVLSNLLKNDKFKMLYEMKRQQQKKYFIEYVRSFGFDVEKEGLNIVDIGWKGTIQDNIQKILGDRYHIEGFYLGLKIDDVNLCSIYNKEGILFSNIPSKVKNYKILTKDYMIYERIFTANHGPVLAYKKQADGKVVPVISDDKTELELYKYIQKYQEKLLSGFMEILRVIEKSKWTPDELYVQMIKFVLWQDCIVFPEKWKIERDIRLKTKENFGNISKNKSKESFRLSKEHFNKGKFLFVDYSYRIPQLLNIKFLYPFSKLYCRLIYLLHYMFIRN